MEIEIRRIYTNYIEKSFFYVGEKILIDKKLKTYKEMFFKEREFLLLKTIVKYMAPNSDGIVIIEDKPLSISALEELSGLDNKDFKSAFNNFLTWGIIAGYSEMPSYFFLSNLLRCYYICDRVTIRQKKEGSITPFKVKVQVSRAVKEECYKKALVLIGDKDFNTMVFGIEELK